jgi:two-component system, sensor histidine kinase
VGQLQGGFNQMLSQLNDQRQELALLIEGLSRSRDEAELANRAKSDFLAKVSHEIRTPMNGVMVSLDLIHETSPDSEQRELADLARSSARSLLWMLNDLLDFSRIEAGKITLDSTLFNPRQLLTHMVELHGKRAQQKGLAIRCSIAEDLPAELCGDPLRLNQILLNLVDNAIKYTEQGEIEITLRFEEASPALTESGDPAVWLRFEVADTGVGVPVEVASRIFEPFFQAELAGAGKNAGVGLGLGIARQLARLMGGELDFCSTTGKGSRFWFSARLRPASACLANPAAGGAAATPEADLPDTALQPPRKFAPGNRVLLAEDNRANREVMARMLTRRGLEVRSAENGRLALALAGAEKFDIVLMDCRMPEMDGFETARAIRALGGEAARVPIVALTAYALVEEKARYLEAGFDDLLGKPFTFEQIEAVLQRWLVSERRDDLRLIADAGPN